MGNTDEYRLRPEQTAQNVSLCPAYHPHRCEIDNMKCHSSGIMYDFFCEQKNLNSDQVREHLREKIHGAVPSTKA